MGKFLLSLLYASIAVAILATAVLAIHPKKPNQSRVFLGGQEIFVDIADTPALQELGLSFREKLNANEGMLFVFQKPMPYGFWMKDMKFPIDIIWFDANRHIVDVWENAEPSSYPYVFTARTPAQFVLEVPAGFFSKYDLELGNTLEIP